MKYAELARRLRLPLGFLLAVVYLVFARPSAGGLLLGLPVALVGLAVRAWASGHIVKNRRLATTGPYAFVRNPLYLGSFLISVGFALVWSWWFLLPVAAFFVLVYAPTIEREQAGIMQRFPDEFPVYLENVPAFVPRITPWRPAHAAGSSGAKDESSGGAAIAYDASLYLKHSEWKAALGFAGATGWLLLRMKLGL